MPTEPFSQSIVLVFLPVWTAKTNASENSDVIHIIRARADFSFLTAFHRVRPFIYSGLTLFLYLLLKDKSHSIRYNKQSLLLLRRTSTRHSGPDRWLYQGNLSLLVKTIYQAIVKGKTEMQQIKKNISKCNNYLKSREGTTMHRRHLDCIMKKKLK